MKDFNVKLVNAYNKYVLIHKFRVKHLLQESKSLGVKFLTLTAKG